MSAYSRNGNKWTISETMRLHREYDLLELNVFDISELHKRTPEAIKFQLLNAEIVNSLENIRGSKIGKFSVKEEVANELSCYKLIKRKPQLVNLERNL